jgi:lipopolysaccharide/colanic/teichoic acid biosynthesis glycosyltransferase
MFHSAEDGGIRLSDYSDKRVTRVGKFLRPIFLDELPQLINIFVGEMSFVGPRPETPFFHRKFSKSIFNWRKRINIKPGLAGLAQNFLFNSFEPEKLEKDLEYIQKSNFFLDLKIISKQFVIAIKNLFRYFDETI